jgi:hypothetical protein
MDTTDYHTLYPQVFGGALAETNYIEYHLHSPFDRLDGSPTNSEGVREILDRQFLTGKQVWSTPLSYTYIQHDWMGRLKNATPTNTAPVIYAPVIGEQRSSPDTQNMLQSISNSTSDLCVLLLLYR